MRLLITGAGGFIGSALARVAVEAGHAVTALARTQQPWRLRSLNGAINIVTVDLVDRAPLGDVLNRARPDCIAHLAWSGVKGGDRNATLQIDNIAVSCRLMTAAAEAGVRHFVATGSQAEYGPRPSIVSEADETSPTTLYGECKLATYRLLNRLATLHDLRFCWLRIFSTYGPRDDPGWMVPSLIGSLLDKQRPPLTRGEQKWDLLHVRDAARAILAACESPAATGLFNLGSGAAPPLMDTVRLIRDLVDPSLQLGFGELPYRPDQVMHLQADTARLRRLGWHPSIDLASGMAETVQWYRDNRWIFAR